LIAAACVIAAAASACGKKGAPLPPIVRVPEAVKQITARRVGGDVVLTLVMPAQNVDGSTPVALGRVIDRCLPRNGRGILHSIGQDQPALLNAWIEKRIFPGAYPPTLREMLAILEPHELSVLDVENLRLHYALTLEHWLRRFEDARARVSGMYDERFVRTWRLYLAGSLAAFNTGNLQLFQVLFARAGSNDVPWTRAHLYGQWR